jgi:hypothetical protein
MYLTDIAKHQERLTKAPPEAIAVQSAKQGFS